MSTKSTIVCGDDFHLYHEAGDRDFVYLELEGVSFEARPDAVMVSIPLHIWEFARRYAGSELRHADQTDAELRQFVEREVDTRMEKYEAANERGKKMVSLFGALIYGTADQPRAQQIEAGFAHFARVRDHHSQIRRAIEALERANARD